MPLAKFSKSRIFLVKYYQEEFQNRPCGKALKKILVLWLYYRFIHMFIRISNRSCWCWWNSLHPTESQSSHMLNKSYPFILTKDTNAEGLHFLSCIFTFNFAIYIIAKIDILQFLWFYKTKNRNYLGPQIFFHVSQILPLSFSINFIETFFQCLEFMSQLFYFIHLNQAFTFISNQAYFLKLQIDSHVKNTWVYFHPSLYMVTWSISWNI